MKIGIIGSRNWDDYNLLMRKLTIEIEDWRINYPEDNKIIFLHHGRIGAENMVTEYVNKTHKFLRQKNFKIKEEDYIDIFNDCIKDIGYEFKKDP